MENDKLNRTSALREKFITHFKAFTENRKIMASAKKDPEKTKEFNAKMREKFVALKATHFENQKQVNPEKAEAFKAKMRERMQAYKKRLEKVEE